MAEADMYHLERIPSIIRARAKIQNEYKLFRADEEIRDRRRFLEYRVKEKQLADKPGIPSITFYMDESSKNEKIIVVGGICSVDALRSFLLVKHLFKWVQEKKIKHEFHFTELTKQNLGIYKKFFTEALSFSDSIGFKAIALPQRSIRNRKIDDVIYQLYSQTIYKAVDHEVQTKRATLPRLATVYLDKVDGADFVTISYLEREIKAGFLKYYHDKLQLNALHAVDSKTNPLVQLSDLYIGSIARILNREEASPTNEKDEFSQFVASMLGLDLSTSKSSYKDIAFVEVIE